MNLTVFSTSNYAQQPLPAGYPAGTLVNYVRTWTATAPEQDAAALIKRPLKDVKQATQYLDGLGRPIQTVMKQGSLNTSTGANVDMISAVTYDAFGREQIKYLPFASMATNETNSDGSFKLNPFQQQADFYNTQLVGETGETNLGGNNLNFAYSQTVFEASPLNRVQESFAPGVNWSGTASGLTETDRKSVKAKYYFNTELDKVRIWSVSNGTQGDFGNYNSATGSEGIYTPGQLYKSITADEKNNQVIEFKDKAGKVILKKVQLTATADNGTGSDYPGWLCTYYIYDDLNQLRCVVQPRGVELIAPTWVLTNPSYLAEQCFRYEYDARQRMIMKKVPGAGEVYMVYDARDRLVMTQDANLRSDNRWMISLYDALNRPVKTGLLANTFNGKTFPAHLAAASKSITYPFTSITTPSSAYWDQYTQTFYDDYDWLTGEGNPVPKKRYEGDDGSFLPASDSYPYTHPLVQSFQTKGMVTGTESKVIGTATNIYTGIYYDVKGRILQTYTPNMTGLVVITNQYNFAGQLLVTYQTTTNTVANQAIGVKTKLNYDELGRLLDVNKVVTTNFADKVVGKMIVKNEYDALGQLKKKRLAPGFNDDKGLETANYDYNIRGWLLGINRDYVKDLNTTNFFGFDLGYDKNGILDNYVPQYNGNISGTIWKSKGDQQKRKYDFAYDAVNRLMKADFTQQNGSAWNTSARVDFSMKMGDGADPLSAYDANGNILAMSQKGLKGTASEAVDDLTYKYLPNSNKLKYVADAVNSLGTKLGDFQEPVQNNTDNKVSDKADYTYDVNGNLNYDDNKAISSITYNYLNLPSLITITGKGTISYTYDATGNKLRKTTTENANATNKNISTTTTTDYLGGFVYESKSDNDPNTADYANRLQFGGHEEGRIRAVYENADAPNTLKKLVFDYFIKDHLGNVRMVLTDEEQRDIYPVASLEPSKLSTEKNYYDIKEAQISLSSTATGITGYTNDNGIGNNPQDATFSAAGSTKLYRLNSNEAKTGLGITLKVMAGDKIDVFGKSYYFQNTTGTSGNSTLPVLDLLTAFLNAPAAAATAVHGLMTPAIINTPIGTSAINTMMGLQNNWSDAAPKKPRAFINVIFFDEQFKAVSYQISMAGSNSIVKDHYAELQNIVVPKNGFVYIYCSNESPVNVFFDNMQVVQRRGPILEETHYYPFGLTMAGISSKAAGSLKNNKGFNGNEIQNKEFIDGSGLELYDFNARTYDQQVGRFIQIDPTPEDGEQESLTPYHFSGNNPSTFNDPNGKCPWCWGAIIGFAVEYGTQVAGNLIQGKSLGESLTDVKGGQLLIGAAAGALSGGISAFVPKTAAGKVVVEGVKIAIDAGESAAKQYNETGTVSLKKTVTDVGSSMVAGKLTGNVKVVSNNTISTTERQLERAVRVAANDASSSGRAATVKQLTGKVSSQKAANQGVQQAVSGSVSNPLQTGADAAVANGTTQGTLPFPTYKPGPAVDNTTQKPITPISF
ncbi:MAG: hypothetical protein H7320_08145 [Ferruginibacter sp.]|nr:hypothetical protein [Ferruginibacter sp.]